MGPRAGLVVAGVRGVVRGVVRAGQCHLRALGVRGTERRRTLLLAHPAPRGVRYARRGVQRLRHDELRGRHPLVPAARGTGAVEHARGMGLQHPRGPRVGRRGALVVERGTRDRGRGAHLGGRHRGVRGGARLQRRHQPAGRLRPSGAPAVRRVLQQVLRGGRATVQAFRVPIREPGTRCIRPEKEGGSS